jgi:CDP-glycerol glycerophosphotransferase (TagB/SpsB family)
MAGIIKEWAVVVNGKVKLCAVADREFFDLPASCDGSVKAKFGNDFTLVDLSEYPGQNPAEGWDWDGTTFSFEFDIVTAPTPVLEETPE